MDCIDVVQILAHYSAELLTSDVALQEEWRNCLAASDISNYLGSQEWNYTGDLFHHCEFLLLSNSWAGLLSLSRI